MRPTLAMAILAVSGRYAIMARLNADSPWVQVESVLGYDNANRFVDDLENDDDARADAIKDIADDDSTWGNDAPSDPPPA